MEVSVYEVGLRDGLQNEAAFIPTADKILLAQMLATAGLRRIELTSFVSPRWIPQLADHAAVAAGVPKIDGVQFSALVPNLRGLDGALAAGLEEIAIFMSATETHSQKNINKSIEEALAVLGETAAGALAKGLRVRAYLSTVFGCPYEGKVDPEVIVPLVHQLLAMGAYEISLGDTIGVSNPRQVKKVVERLTREVAVEKLALHLHDTHGTALANVLAGFDAGVRTFDSAFGGLGGCPYAPGASGNLATEDLVYMLREMEIETGVDLDRLADASVHVASLVGRPLPSKALQAELAYRAKRAAKAENPRKGKSRATGSAAAGS